jgi:hypothetical protein
VVLLRRVWPLPEKPPSGVSKDWEEGSANRPPFKVINQSLRVLIAAIRTSLTCQLPHEAADRSLVSTTLLHVSDDFGAFFLNEAIHFADHVAFKNTKILL